MATKTIKYNKTGIAELPEELSVLYRIETAKGVTNYVGVAARRKVVETVSAHLGAIPGATVKVEQFAGIADARKKQANIIKRSGAPKYNT